MQIQPHRLAYRQATLAAALDTTRQTISNLEKTGVLPPRIEITPGLKVWPAEVIHEWLKDLQDRKEKN